MVQPRGRGDLPEYSFDPVVLADLLGAPVAMLSEPPGLVHYATDESHSLGHAPQIPVAVTIEHRLDSADPVAPGPGVMVNVRTRLRQARGEPDSTSTRANLTDAVEDYQFSSVGRSGVPPSFTGRPLDLRDRLRQPLLDGWSWRDVVVDGVLVQWEYVALDDFATSEEIIACGGTLGFTLIAVVGPRQVLRQIALKIVHPHTGRQAVRS